MVLTKLGVQMSWQIGEDNVVRGQFAEDKVLGNYQDTQFRAVGDRWYGPKPIHC
jgi:hypothetical protein